MRRIKATTLLVLLAAGIVTLVAGRPECARAESSQSYVGDWVYYTWETRSPGSKWGDGDVTKIANVPMFAANIQCDIFRAQDHGGTGSGGAADTGMSGAGLVVMNPVPGRTYSWTASCDLSDSELKANVDLGENGYVAGRAEGAVEMQVYGDVNWKISRTVGAQDFVGGSWILSWPPQYMPPATGAQIAYSKKDDVEPLAAHDHSSGGDHHVQVRYRGRVSGAVMANSESGILKRHAIGNVTLRASANLILSGFTQVPVPTGSPPAAPIMRARLRMWFGKTMTFPYGLLSEEEAEDEQEEEEAAEGGDASDEGETTEDDEPAGDGETTDDDEEDDDEGDGEGEEGEPEPEPDPSAGGDTAPEDIPPPPPENDGEHDPKKFHVEDW